MKYDYSKLRGKITEKFGTIGRFAESMNMSYTSASNKLNNIVPWDQLEIERAVEVLDLNWELIEEYFFTRK
ncbi:DUF739 family protein [Microaceticoccus formicicus]|uniref:DUF739 family protein n=1 Tax=Microaceticoccus formicicus TaxID=3118105 RepID=UPI003CD041CC|nr:DUF739 family protein [Peptoniphilaceae bacterium AMB_02]